MCPTAFTLLSGDSHVGNQCNRLALERTGNAKLLRVTVQEIHATGNQCRGGSEGSNSLTFFSAPTPMKPVMCARQRHHVQRGARYVRLVQHRAVFAQICWIVGGGHFAIPDTQAHRTKLQPPPSQYSFHVIFRECSATLASRPHRKINDIGRAQVVTYVYMFQPATPHTSTIERPSCHVVISSIVCVKDIIGMTAHSLSSGIFNCLTSFFVGDEHRAITRPDVVLTSGAHGQH